MNKFLWLTYPLLVLVVILFSAKYLLSGQVWTALSNKQDRTALDKIKIDKLSKKLNFLKSAELNSWTNDWNYLVSVAPMSKQITLLLGEISQAASASGVGIISYKGMVNDVTATESAKELTLDVSFSVNDIKTLAQLLQQLENRLPLVSIGKITYAQKKADISIMGIWSPIPKLASNPDAELVDSRQMVADLRNKLTGFVEVVTRNIDLQGTNNASGNPF